MLFQRHKIARHFNCSSNAHDEVESLFDSDFNQGRKVSLKGRFVHLALEAPALVSFDLQIHQKKACGVSLLTRGPSRNMSINPLLVG